MNQKPSATDFIRRGNYTTGTGAFNYWQGSFKDAIKASKDGLQGSPFETVRTQDLRYQDSDNYGSDARIKLNDNDGFGQSSFITFTLKDGWQGLFYVKTENNDWFEDNVFGDYVSDSWNDDDPFTEELREATDLLAAEGYPAIWIQDNAELTDSRAVFALDGDNADYVSFDIDGESANVGQARIRIDGDQYVQNKEIDNEVFITMIWLRKWNPDVVLTIEDDKEDEDEGDGEGEEGISCPVGFEDNGFGICVPIQDDEDDEDEEDDGDDQEQSIDDVGAGAIILLLAAVAGTVYLAVKL